MTTSEGPAEPSGCESPTAARRLRIVTSRVAGPGAAPASARSLRVQLVGLAAAASRRPTRAAVPLALSATALGLLVVTAIDGKMFLVLLAAAAIAAAALCTVWTIRQLERLAEEHRLSRADDLTGLPNRRAFIEALEEATADDGASMTPFAVVLLDLAEFRELNDTLGHAAGDLVLQRIAARLAAIGPDAPLVARLGADEFAALIPRPPERVGAEEALELARGMLGATRRPQSVEGMEVTLDGSIGIALYPEHARDGRGVLRRADIALFQAKRKQTSIAVYRPGADTHTRERLALAGDLRQAIAHHDLVVHYQPQLDLATGAVTGLEALVRWPRPDGKGIGPSEFLPLAERLGLMPSVTTRVLEVVIAQQRAWLMEGLTLPVAVNLSVSDLHDHTLVARMEAMLTTAGVPAELVTVEVTEHVLMDDPDGADAVLRRLRRLGIRVALDDFGTGHSSLAYVQRLSLDTLKIDRHFVTKMNESPGNATIVRLAVELARAFDLRIVAEGVERPAIASALARLGCDIAQGFWISAPLGPQMLRRWLVTHDPRRWVP